MKKACLSVAALLFAVGCGEVQTAVEKSEPLPGPSREDLVGAKLDSLQGDPDGLKSFLKSMPKGGDLHSHLLGAVSTESLIQWGSDDGLCVDSKSFAAVSPSPSPCDVGTTALSTSNVDLELYANVLKSWSLDGYKGPMIGRHNHAIAASEKLEGALGEARMDDAVAEVMATAAKNNVVYVELLSPLGAPSVGELASKYVSPGDTWDEAYLLGLRDKIIADPAFQAAIDEYKAAIPGWVQGARGILKCSGADADAGCGVDVRFQMAASRAEDRAYVFAEWVYAYELAQVAPDVVGVNLAAPEESASSLAFYDDEMAALDVLHRYNADESKGLRPVHISLHAGELIQEVLPPTQEGLEHLTYHIRRAVELGHAERIGHGVDLAYESDGAGTIDLLDVMRKAGVMVEVCLSANDILLGTSGARHPLHSYMVQDVPVALASDEPGVLRTSITDDYVRAATAQGVSYRKLKEMARASLEHSFLSGESLWAARDSFYVRVDKCEFDSPTGKPEDMSPGCTEFLAANERAAMQWKLEGAFEVFETSVAPASP